jgi:superfamily II DNA/RNA helicase
VPNFLRQFYPIYPISRFFENFSIRWLSNAIVQLFPKAKTGTGKTLSFLIPAVEATLKVAAGQRNGCISVLAISPTRELAQQIADEVMRLKPLTFLGPIYFASSSSNALLALSPI